MADSILEQVKALADGNTVQVATEKIGGENYEIIVEKADADAAPAIDTSAKTITITKQDLTLADADALKAVVAEVKIGGVIGAPTIDASGKALDCSTADFTKDTVQTCADINLPAPTSSILDQVTALTDSQSVQVATEKIGGENYKIFVKKDDSGDKDTELDTSAKTITITKKDVTLADADALKAVVAEVKIGGVIGAPTIDASGKALDCSTADFTKDTVQTCADINLPAPTSSILEQVKALADGNTVQVATEKIGGENYEIIVEKADADAAPAIDTSAKTITITKQDLTLADADALKAVVAEVKIGGVQGAPTIATTGGTALDCSTADFDQSTVQTCADINLTSKDYIDELQEIQKYNDQLVKSSKDLVKPLIKAIGSSDDLTATSIIAAIKSPSATSKVKDAAKALFPAGTDLSSINEDSFKDAVAAQFKSFVSLNELLNQMPNAGTGVLENSGGRFTEYKTGSVDVSLTPIAQFYYDATIPVCGSRPFVSDTELTDANAKECLKQFHTTAYTALSQDGKCGKGGDLDVCHKKIAESGLKALYNGGEVDDMKFDISIEYPDLIVA